MAQSVKEHREKVGLIITKLLDELLERIIDHDKSKEESPEKELFDKYRGKLEDVTYDSDEYHEMMDELEPAIQHHYKENRHHPQHFENGLNDMNLVDIVELFADWLASTTKHKDGDIEDSVEKNKDRFDLTEPLASILLNTAEDYDFEGIG